MNLAKVTLGGRLHSDRGSGGPSLTWLLLTPAIFGLIFGAIAVGWRVYGSGLALDAANVGARAAAALPVSVERGREAAQRFLDTSAVGTLSETTVTVDLVGGQVVVVVTGETTLWPSTITQTASLIAEVAQ